MQKQLRPDSKSVGLTADRTSGFRLIRYFMLTSLAAFAIVGTVLFVLQRGEEEFFAKVQNEQAAFFAKVQAELADAQREAARSDLLAVHEAGHVNLARLFANVLWQRHFAPFVAQAEKLPVERCRSLPDTKDAVGTRAREACFAALGKRIMGLPGFATLDDKAYETMKASSVFKIKVFDLRGITVYSSEHVQIGEDKAGNAGWRTAVGGRPASELTHRDRFSAFEGVVENRDLISSYLPVYEPDGSKVIGVFEIYSDVTPLLESMTQASTRIAGLVQSNQRVVERNARDNEDKVGTSSNWFLAIVGGLLALLYLALLVLVRIGQRIIDQQARAQEQAAQREERWHREKMASLATMAAAIAHEVGNPLTTISLLAQDIAERQVHGECPGCQPQVILQQTWRIANMTRQMADFASARSESLETVDVNQIVKAVCDFLGFDARFRTTPIEFRPGASLPSRVVIPDHLNEVLMNVVQLVAEVATGSARILVQTIAQGDEVAIQVGCEPARSAGSSEAARVAADARIEAARRRLLGMQGRLSLDGTTIRIILTPATQPASVT